ncbi:hypothetical protein [Streptomyces sp. E5N91]|uniref:hypothetical protein n=1 Tax=Streptomyces sp. E5N91 TaxID=1851996 RepID=UPI000EF5ADFE|nr:hypothetical protein [Streptomyces sp. E5N91]
MQGRKDRSSGPDPFEYDEGSDTSQRAELLGPDDDEGFYTSQLHDWVPLCPQMRDSGVRLYWILRALVIEKRGPVRKLTLLQLCYLLPSKQMKPGQAALPSSLARIRSLLSELSDVGLISTPEGKPVKTSSRAGASAAPLRIRINDRPRRGYDGPRNAFALLDEVRRPAAEAAEEAIRKERQRSARKRAERIEEAGQIASPLEETGQISSPRGQISSPRGQISSPHSGSDLQDRDLPFRLPAKTFRSDRGTSVRPSLQVVEADVSTTDGRTDAGSSDDGKVDRRATGRASDSQAGIEGSRRPLETTPGMEVLLRVGRMQPQLALAGRVLTDQAKKLDSKIADSEAAGEPWRISELTAVLGAPLNEPVRKSPGGVISARIDRLVRTPRTAMLPGQASSADSVAPRREASSALAADRPVEESVRHRVRGECPECGADSPGEVLCGACLEWPRCAGGCGRLLEHGGTCEACVLTEHHAQLAATPADDGTCPGHGGKPCGRPVQTLGLCARCRIQAEHDRAARDANWHAQVAAVSARTAAAEARGDSALF